MQINFLPGTTDDAAELAALHTEVAEHLTVLNRLTTKKPWAIETSCFSPCSKPLYLIAMAVTPSKQHLGIGSLCLKEAKNIAKAFPSEAIRLDTYDDKAGAGHFYKLCGYSEVGRTSYRGVSLIYYELKI